MNDLHCEPSHGHNKATTNTSIHMYQEDMSGESAIENAFKKNSIFSIKAFIDNLLDIQNDEGSNSFRNCFDGALLLMIKKGMDVTDLCNSSLFYPSIWLDYKLFSKFE